MIFIGSSAFAQRNDNPYFKKAQVSFKKAQYNKSLKLLKYTYNFKKTRSIPPAALFLIAVNYQKLNKHQKSIFYFKRLIKNNYIKKHSKVIKAMKKDEIDDVEIPKILNTAYFYLGQSYYSLFSKTSKIQFAEKAKNFFKICDEVDYNEKCETFLESIDAKILFKKNMIKTYEFYMYAGRYIYQERLTIKNTTSGVIDELKANNNAICYGAGIRYGDLLSGYQVNACAFYGTASVQNIDGANIYNQSGIPFGGIHAELGKYIRLDEGRTRLGIALPVVARAGSYTEPIGHTIPDAATVKYGIVLSAGMQIPYIEFETKFALLEHTNMLILSAIINF